MEPFSKNSGRRSVEGWEGVRDGVASEGGWPLYLQRYTEQLAKG